MSVFFKVPVEVNKKNGSVSLIFEAPADKYVIIHRFEIKDGEVVAAIISLEDDIPVVGRSLN